MMATSRRQIMSSRIPLCFALVGTLISSVFANPKIDNGGFLPSKRIESKDQLAQESILDNQTITPSASDKAGRFGFPTYATDGQNYPQSVNNVVPGLYGPVKLDIGGLVLGTIVGLGAFFILPKIFHVISAPNGGYKRSEDEPSAGGIGVGEVYRRLSDSLDSMNLQSNSCVQRAICATIQSSSGSVDSVLTAIAKSDVVASLVTGTDWELAVKAGTRGESCGASFPKCPFTIDSIVKPLVKYLVQTKN